jgi:hydroxylamine reductase
MKKTIKKAVKKKTAGITKDSVIADVVREHPEAIAVFLQYGLHCVGCSMAQYDTIASGARSHGVNPEYIVKDLNTHITKVRSGARGK